MVVLVFKHTRAVYQFERQDIEMHHLSYVRRDIGSKLRNSSAKANFNRNIDKIVDHFNKWTFGQKALLAGMEERLYDIKEVTPLFDI